MEGFHSDMDLIRYFDVDFCDLKYWKSFDLIDSSGVCPVDEFLEGLTRLPEGDSAIRQLE